MILVLLVLLLDGGEVAGDRVHGEASPRSSTGFRYLASLVKWRLGEVPGEGQGEGLGKD